MKFPKMQLYCRVTVVSLVVYQYMPVGCRIKIRNWWWYKDLIVLFHIFIIRSSGIWFEESSAMMLRGMIWISPGCRNTHNHNTSTNKLLATHHNSHSLGATKFFPLFIMKYFVKILWKKILATTIFILGAIYILLLLLVCPWGFLHHLTRTHLLLLSNDPIIAWVTRRERSKGVKDKVKPARRATN